MTAVLDEVLPAYRHRERHATRIAAAPETVWRALHTVSAGDLRLTRALTTIRARAEGDRATEPVAAR
jgi:hypothetical protein